MVYWSSNSRATKSSTFLIKQREVSEFVAQKGSSELDGVHWDSNSLGYLGLNFFYLQKWTTWNF